MKKIGTLLIFLALVVVCLVQLPADAQAASESDLTFKLRSDGQSYYVSACNSSASGELVIPSTYNGKDVTSIGADAFENCSRLTSVTIPDSVTVIGSSAFQKCSALESMIIPNSVVTIHGSAFADCESLQSVTIGNGVEVIGDYVFNDCYNLKSIVIPGSVKSIGMGAFDQIKDIYNRPYRLVQS